MTKVQLPGGQEIEAEYGIVVIGANGSGKTRLGSWLDITSAHKDRTLRISAQKSLNIPENIRPMSVDKAKSDLIHGFANADLKSASDYKPGHKYGGKPETFLVNDYEKLLVFLFSEQNQIANKYRDDSLKEISKVHVPLTKIDKIKKIWGELMPHREFITDGGNIQTRAKVDGHSAYHASEMSDGERVIIYLIGQCLSAPENGIIIIDEPELHLHKSIQYTLWNKIERERSDCCFVYLTHDIEFAVSRNSFEKIWLESYDGTNWKWSSIKESEGLPEELALEVYGSRRKILLVEGKNGKEDVQFYQNIFEDFLVKPCGNCNNVIEYTKSLRQNKEFHHLEVYGLIDRDRRTNQEVNTLEKHGIYTLNVAEVENLFAIPEILEVVSKQLKLASNEKEIKVKKFVFDEVSKEIKTQIQSRVNEEMGYHLSRLDLSTNNGSLPDFVKANIDDVSIRKKIEDEFNKIVAEEDYRKLLYFYNRKSIASRIGDIFGLKKDELPKFVLRLSKNDEHRSDLKSSILKYFPDAFIQILNPKNEK